MRNTIKAYIGLTDDEKKKLWEEATFVFDTNVYLNMYRYSKKTRDSLLRAMENMNARIWMPQHVAVEFARHRAEVIYQVIGRYAGIEESILGKIQNDLRLRKDDSDYQEIQGIMHKWLEDYEKRNTLFTSPSDDEILKKLLQLYDGKVGKPYDDGQLSTLKKAAEERYKCQTPPGYKDAKKATEYNDNNAYGDYIVWRQIMDYARDKEKDIVYVTHDQKEDWWYTISGKTVGPRFELVEEFQRETRRSFHMYNMESFITLFSENDATPLDDSVIVEVKAYANDSDNSRPRDLITRNISDDIHLFSEEEMKTNIEKLDKRCMELRQRVYFHQEDLNRFCDQYKDEEMPPEIVALTNDLRYMIRRDINKIERLNKRRNALVHSISY